MAQDKSASDKIGKATFRFSEAVDTEPQKEHGDAAAGRQARHIERALPAEDRPAKAVNDADHRVEGVKQPPLPGHHTRAEPDRRYIQAELHDERNNVAEVPVFDIE